MISYPQFAKIDVNEENAIPLYKWLTAETKFLIGRDGNIVSRFEPTDMKNLKEKIKECL